MGKKSAPAPPDYRAAAEETAAGSRQAARDQTYANRIDQSTPWGSLDYESYLGVDPATGEQVTKWRQNEQLTPGLQAALDSQIGLQQGRSDLAGGMMGDIEGMMGTQMDFSKYGDLQGPGQQGRMSGAGGGLQGMDLEGLPAYKRQRLMQDMGFDDPGLDSQNLEKNLDYGGAPQVGSPEWTRAQAEKSVYDRGASRLDPQIAKEQQALDVRLRSQGLAPGDEAYTAQMDDLQRRKTDAYDALDAQAMQEGSRQAQSMFGMESAYRDQSTGEEDRQKQFRNMALSGQFGQDAQRQAQMYDITEGQGNFTNQARMGQMGADLAARMGEGGLRAQQAQIGNQAAGQNWQQQMQQMQYNNNQGYRGADYANMLRQTGMNEEMMQRQQRLNEVNALMSGQQVSNPQFQGFTNQSLAQGADYSGAAQNQYQGELNQFGANQALTNSLIGAAGQFGGMAGMMSDRRLKRNVKFLTNINSTNWYEFDYIWGDHAIGVMADEVPHAAFETPSGYLMVDYSKV
jgi:hypothetical protein